MKNLFLLIFSVLMCISCVSYEKCKRKFGQSTVYDTLVLSHTDTLFIQKDCVQVVLKTIDTTQKQVQVYRSGRASLEIKRTKEAIEVKATCDSIYKYFTITKKIVVAKAQKFGVHPLYKSGFLITCFMTIVLFILLLLERRSRNG